MQKLIFFEDWVTDLKTMTVAKINAQSTVVTFARVGDHLFKNIYVGALWKQLNISCNTSSTKKNLLHQSENFVRGEHDPDHLLSDLKFQHWRICFIDLFISFEFPTIKTLSFVGAKWSKMSSIVYAVRMYHFKWVPGRKKEGDCQSKTSNEGENTWMNRYSFQFRCWKKNSELS